MSSAYLPDFVENATDDLDILVPAALRGELDFTGLQKLCDRFRQRAVCSFLMSGDPIPFATNMMQSAGAAVTLLPSIDDGQKVTSQARPLYDAIGGGFWEAADALARLSRVTWNPAREYEDDFLFVMFLVKHCFEHAAEAECRKLVAEHERAAEGGDEEHRDVCLGLLEHDGARFHAGLTQILAVRAARVEAMVARDAIAEEDWSWLRYFSSEGLALLRLADRSGLPVGSEYLHVSELLRHAPAPPFDPHAWRQPRPVH